MKSLRILFIFLIIGGFTFSLTVPPPPPPGPVGPYLNGVFPTTTPGAGGSWVLADAAPELQIPSPLRILPFPGSSDLLVLTKVGELWRISLEEQRQELVLDITDRTFYKGEGGSVGLALHPEFGNPTAPDKQILYLFYRNKPNVEVWSEKGFNRLSKFYWDPQTETFDPDSEEILFQQYDRSTWHNGGGMFFGPDGFLYLSLGDEGHDFQAPSTQRLDGGFFSGILRIDVENDPTRSHPIRRQPLPNETAPSGWGATYSQGYSIPNDNPWLSPDSSGLEEFVVLGVRSPYSTHFDSVTQQIWLADVGSDVREEINKVEIEDNLQWPYMEGDIPSEKHDKPEQLIGNEKGVFFQYERSVGTCIIGGGIYRGTLFPELNEKYLFADWTRNKIMALNNTSSSTEPEFETLVSSIGGHGFELPEQPGITGIFPMPDGEILVAIASLQFKEPGLILRLERRTQVPDPPAKLSELGVFTDLENLIPVPGFIPYGVNAPLWSDRAVKYRWMAIPNDGEFNETKEQINFGEVREWDFPEGTVFVKHFDLPTTTDPYGPTVPLETRFFVIGENGIGYGLTYKWNEEGTEAFLLGGGTSRDFDIMEGGQVAYQQTWDYPSRDQCMTCHNDNAEYVLGVNTPQLNGDVYYPQLNREMNQLDYLNQIGVFGEDIGAAATHLQTHNIEDSSIDLEIRIRSYMDANCASCHRLGGIPNLDLDFRFYKPLRLQNFINTPTQSLASDPNRMVVLPGNHAESELWVRDASKADNRMPPLGRNIVDQIYVDSLAKWIDNLEENVSINKELLVFPNPSRGWLGVRVNDAWNPPFQLSVWSVSGQLMHQEDSDQHLVYMNLEELSAGSYVLEITGGKARETRKFVLQ